MDMIFAYGNKTKIEAWQPVVHVCRRWRNVVFGSARRLNLRLVCTPRTRVRDTLDVWPALPLLVLGDMFLSSGVDDIVVALGQTNRVCQVDLQHLLDWPLDIVLAAMQVPFPQLTQLRLTSFGETPPVVPKSFFHPRSGVFFIQRGYRIFRGPRDLRRCPSTQHLPYSLFQSNRF